MRGGLDGRQAVALGLAADPVVAGEFGAKEEPRERAQQGAAADQLARMAQTRGATEPLLVIPERRTVSLGSAPVRYRAKPVSGEPIADQLRDALTPFVKADDGPGAPEGFVRTGHFGVVGMRERAARVGGSLEISGGRAGGVEVRVRVPAAMAHEEDYVLAHEGGSRR